MMHLRLSFGSFLCALVLFVAQANAQLPIPSPTSSPSESTTPRPASTPAFPVPAPNPAPPLSRATPPPPAPMTKGPSPLYVQQLTPVVQVWRSNSLTPELPLRRGRYLSPILVAPSENVVVRLQFGAQASGKSVIVYPGPGVTINPSQQVYILPSTAECSMSVALGPSFLRGAVSFYCEGIITTLSLGRAVPPPLSAGTVQEGIR
jgi:hypothetical protein